MANRDMARPKLTWGGPPGTVKPPPSQGEAVGRGVGALLVLTNPVVALMGLIATVLLTRPPLMRRVRGWWVIVGGLVLALATFRWTWRAYLTPWVNVLETGRGSGWNGAAIGAVAADRWSAWVVGQLPLAALLGLVVGGWVMMRRQRFSLSWRNEDDVARNPWVGRRPAAKAAAKPYPAGTPLAEMSFRLGSSPTGEPVRLAATSLMQHAAVTGPTGVGKTTTLLRLMHAVLVTWETARCPVVMFDFKADPGVRDALRTWAGETGRRFWFVSVTEEGDHYNPLTAGSAEEVASRLVDTIASARDGGFSEPHHKAVGERWLIMTTLVLDDLAAKNVDRKDAGRPYRRTLDDLAQLMQINVVKTEMRLAGPQAQARAKRLLDEVAAEKDLARSIAGMRSRIALMAETAAGRVLVDDPDGLNLEEAIRAGDVVLFGLSAQTNSAAAGVVGNLAIGDLGAIFDRFQHESWARRSGRRAFLFLDEFSGLGGDSLRALLERARNGGAAITVSTQMSDAFLGVSPEFEASVWGNSNLWLLHQQSDKDAEPRAKAVGTERAWTETLQVHEDAGPLGVTGGGTGVGSLRQSEHFRVHPNELKHLGTGQVVVFEKRSNLVERVYVDQVTEAATDRVLTSSTLKAGAEARSTDGRPPARAAKRLTKGRKAPGAAKASTTGTVGPAVDEALSGSSPIVHDAGSARSRDEAPGSWGWSDGDDDQGWGAEQPR